MDIGLVILEISCVKSSEPRNRKESVVLSYVPKQNAEELEKQDSVMYMYSLTNTLFPSEVTHAAEMITKTQAIDLPELDTPTASYSTPQTKS
jgi:hypothetical protein